MRQTTQKEIEAVLKLDGPARAKHFVKRVLDAEAAWSLWKNGWPLLATSDETPVLPLWPAREYAELHRNGDLAEYELDEIHLEDLLDNVLPMLAEQGVLVGIFPTPAGKSVPIKADELAEWLRKLDEEYYGSD
jgi:hypothetical protein